MSIVLDKTELTVGELMQAVRQMEPYKLPASIVDMVARCPEAFSQIENELITNIHIPLPDAMRQRYRALIRKRDRNTIEPEELAELIALNNEIEIRNADRIGWIAALAKLRNKSLRDMMAELGIEPGTYA